MNPRFSPWITSRTIGYGFLAAFFLVVLVNARQYGHIDNGDSNNLVKGARVAVQCIRNRQFVECGYLKGSIQTLVFPYPLLQYLPASLFVWLQFSDASTLKGLALINFVAVVAMLVAIVVVFRARPRLGALLVVALIGSTLLYQSTSAFGEAVAASLVVAAVLAGIRKRPLAILLLVTLASSGKETLAPFVVLLVLACARTADDGVLPAKKLTTAAIAGGAAGWILNSAFNVFRFGSPRNILYLDPSERTPGVARKVEFFGALFASPAAGVIWFWPLVSLLALGGSAVGVRRVLRDRRDWRRYVSILAISAAFVGFFVGLSSWYAPFGWITYGPRLAVPILPGVAVAVVHVLGDTILEMIRRWRRALVLLVPVVALSMLQYGSPWRWNSSILQLISADSTCPIMTQMDVTGDPATYYRCTSHFMWRTKPMVLDDVVDIGLSVERSAWLLAVVGSSLLCAFVIARRDPSATQLVFASTSEQPVSGPHPT